MAEERLIDIFLMQAQKYGLILDTNIYILYVTGIVRPEDIGNTDKTTRYTYTHFEIVRSLIDRAKNKIPVITPHIVPEITHLLGVDRNRSGSRGSAFENVVLSSLGIAKEEYHKTSQMIRRDLDIVKRFGISDTSIIKAEENGYAMLSDDSELVAYLQMNNRPAITLQMLYSFQARSRHSLRTLTE